MSFCKSTFPVENGIIRCQLEAGHTGDHSASWDWEDGPLVEEGTSEMPDQAASQGRRTTPRWMGTS